MFLFGDSFDGYADAQLTQKWTSRLAGSAGSMLVTPAVGARGTQALVMTMNAGGGGETSGTVGILPTMPVVTGSTMIMGVRVNIVSGMVAFGAAGGTTPDNGAPCLFTIRNAAANVVWCAILANGLVRIYRGTTVLGTTSVGFQEGVETYLEVKILLSATVGTVDVWINNVNRLSLTGQNTGGTAWDEFRWGNFGSSGIQACSIVLDDFYLLDGSGSYGNARFGPVGAYATRPNAAGTNSAWTRSTGADQWATIDDTLMNGDVDYNSTATPNARDMLNFPVLPVSGGVIKGIQATCQVRNETGGPSTFQIGTRLAGTTYLGTANPVPSTYGVLRECWPVKPSDNTAWTEADYNAAEFGYEKAS